MGMTTQLLYSGADFMKELGWLTTIIVSLAGVLMGFYAVYIGFLFATASDANKRKAARERLIKVMASAFIIIALAALLGAININFSKIKTDNNNKSVEDRYSSGNLKGWNYSENVEMNLGYKNNPIGYGGYTSPEFSGNFKISMANFTKDGVKIDADEYEFGGCEVTEPSSFNNILPGDQIIEISDDGKTLQYNFKGTMVNYKTLSSDGKHYILVKVTIGSKNSNDELHSVNMIVYLTGRVEV